MASYRDSLLLLKILPVNLEETPIQTSQESFLKRKKKNKKPRKTHMTLAFLLTFCSKGVLAVNSLPIGWTDTVRHISETMLTFNTSGIGLYLSLFLL